MNKIKKDMFSQIILSIALVLSGALLHATSDENNPDRLFQQAQLLYDSKDYKSALPFFKKAVKLSPMKSNYHHMLGKCYGRIAEEGSWITALRNVGKTLKAFRKAVELDNNNVLALRDLEEFYRRAPGFLGGDTDKANEISQQLSGLDLSENVEKPEIATPYVP